LQNKYENKLSVAKYTKRCKDLALQNKFGAAK
jgi:hypothetical protein